MKQKTVFVCDYCGKMIAKYEEDIPFQAHGADLCNEDCARAFRSRQLGEEKEDEV